MDIRTRFYLISYASHLTNQNNNSLGQEALKHLRKTDASLVDCSLSQRGTNQAYALAKSINPDFFQGHVAILTSPLTRALLTASILFKETREDLHVPVFVLPMLAEVNSNPHRGIPENTGRRIEELYADANVADFLSHPNVDLSHVLDSTWPHIEKHTRYRNQEILSMILSRPEPRIVVVAHCNVIHELFVDSRMKPETVANCTPIHAHVTSTMISLCESEHEWF